MKFLRATPSRPAMALPRRRLHSIILIERTPSPLGALPTSFGAQKCGMVMSVTTQIIFPYMSDARTPAMDVQMTAQDVGMLRSFSVFLSAMLILDNGYGARMVA